MDLHVWTMSWVIKNGGVAKWLQEENDDMDREKENYNWTAIGENEDEEVVVEANQNQMYVICHLYFHHEALLYILFS